MSTGNSEIVKCPKCSEDLHIQVWQSINVTLDLTLREQLFEDEINSFRYKKCGYESLIGVPLPYHDMSRKFAVQFYPIDFIEVKNL